MDIALLDAIQTHLRSPFMDALMLFATHLGDLAIVWLVAAAVLIAQPKRRLVVAFKTAAVSLACLIAFSRLYLYVHYPSDILVGAVLGVAVGIASVAVAKKLMPQPPPG